MEYWMAEGSSPCQGKSLAAKVTYTQQRTTQARTQARWSFLHGVLGDRKFESMPRQKPGGQCYLHPAADDSGQDASTATFLAPCPGGERVGPTRPLHHSQDFGQSGRLLVLGAEDVEDAARGRQRLVSKDSFCCSQVLFGDGHSQRRQAILKETGIPPSRIFTPQVC